MQKVAFKAGETIIREGDEGDTAFFIVSGAVDVAVGRANPRIVGRLRDRRSVWRNVADRARAAIRDRHRVPVKRNAWRPPIRTSSPQSRRTRNAPSAS